MDIAGPPPQPPQVPYVPRVGTDDLNPPVMPPGGLPPGLGPDLGEGPGPLPGGVPGRRGGGMHVGPGDPLFRSPPRPGLFPGGDPGRFPGDIPGGPDFDPAEPGMPGMAVPPGARWDPINPPGLEVSSLTLIWLPFTSQYLEMHWSVLPILAAKKSIYIRVV